MPNEVKLLPCEELVENVARAIWTTSQDHIVGVHGTYPLKARMSWDEARRAAKRAIEAMTRPTTVVAGEQPDI